MRKKESRVKKKAIRSAFLDTVPVMTGYVFLGFGFGILLQQNGYGVLWSAAMSLFIYAGSMQYMAISLLSGGAGLLTAALTTLVVNARHLFYGISMVDAYKGAGKKKPYLIFALTDETYSLVTQAKLPEGMDRTAYCFWVSLFDQCYWIVGCMLGAVAGYVLPIDFTGVSFVLTALFVTMFVEQWLTHKDHGPALIGVVCTAVCLAIFGSQYFLIPSMAAIAGLLILGRKTGRRAENG